MGLVNKCFQLAPTEGGGGGGGGTNDNALCTSFLWRVVVNNWSEGLNSGCSGGSEQLE